MRCVPFWNDCKHRLVPGEYTTPAPVGGEYPCNLCYYPSITSASIGHLSTASLRNQVHERGVSSCVYPRRQPIGLRSV